jgi:Tat protein secretion system quality control protein TatD with DNase activity
MIRGAGGVRGVLHCFTGGPGLLDAALDAGWFISFAGMVTFRNFDGARPAPRRAGGPAALETDSPYLAPVPHRGRATSPRSSCRPAAPSPPCGRGPAELHGPPPTRTGSTA